MDTMETIEVASGLSMELKMAVAVCVVLATMLPRSSTSYTRRRMCPPLPCVRVLWHLRFGGTLLGAMVKPLTITDAKCRGEVREAWLKTHRRKG